MRISRRLILVAILLFIFLLLLLLSGCVSTPAGPASPEEKSALARAVENGKTIQAATEYFTATPSPSLIPTLSPTLTISPTPTLTPTPAPVLPGILGASFVFDQRHGYVLGFGGLSETDGNLSDDTWIWDGTTWIQPKTTSAPPPRMNYGLAYDAARGQVVLFGGWDEQQALNDTWLWDGENWVEVHPPVSPSPRLDARSVYDAARQVALLFGGSRPEGREVLFLDETWTWDGQTWTEHPSGELSNGAIPQPSMAYDAARQQVVLWQYGTGTWTWDGRAWTHQKTANSPDLFTEGVLGYDESREQVILWHDAQSGTDNPETWTWDGADWSFVDTGDSPGPEFSAESHLIDDTQRQALLLFAVISRKEAGGCPGDCFEMPVWSWTGSGWVPVLTAENTTADIPLRKEVAKIGNYD